MSSESPPEFVPKDGVREPPEVLADGAETYSRKQEDYGDAWRNFGKLMSILTGGEPVTIQSEHEWNLIQLYVYHFNKLSRSFNGEFMTDGDMNFESLVDTPEDEMVYSSMHVTLLELMEAMDAR